MIRLLIVLGIIILILFILKSRSKNKGFSSNFYKKTIFVILVLGILFFLATSGKFLIPQFLNLLKIGLPIITKFIGF